MRGKDFAVVSNPEFLREGTAFQDYINPPLTLIGTNSEVAEAKFHELYKDISGEFISVDIEIAEIMKYVNNAYHGSEIVFANEMGNINKALGFGSAVWNSKRIPYSGDYGIQEERITSDKTQYLADTILIRKISELHRLQRIHLCFAQEIRPVSAYRTARKGNFSEWE